MSALRVCRESCSRKLEQPNEERSQEARCTRWRPQDPRAQRMSIHHHCCVTAACKDGPRCKQYRAKNHRKIDRKSRKNRPKIDEKSTEIVEKSFLGRFGRSRSRQGRFKTRSGRHSDAQKSVQGRSWDAPGSPKPPKRRRKASPGRSQDAPRPPR